jgi:DNA primase
VIVVADKPIRIFRCGDGVEQQSIYMKVCISLERIVGKVDAKNGQL